MGLDVFFLLLCSDYHELLDLNEVDRIIIRGLGNLLIVIGKGIV